MVAVRTVFVIDVDLQLLADRARNVELHTLCVADQIWRHVNFHVVLTDHAIGGEVFAFEVRVDRHVMLGASSTNRRNEVDSGDATSLLYQLGRIGSQKQIHVWRNPVSVSRYS